MLTLSDLLEIFKKVALLYQNFGVLEIIIDLRDEMIKRINHGLLRADTLNKFCIILIVEFIDCTLFLIEYLGFYIQSYNL